MPKDKIVTYLPTTFSYCMEAFGKNLQRKNLYSEIEEMKELIGRQDICHSDIKSLVVKSSEKMKKIIEVTSAETCSLKNKHNHLFLSLMDNLQN